MYRLKIQKTVSNDYLFINTRLRFKSLRLPRSSWNSYDFKLDNSISRAKSNCLKILQFNKFYYFFTQTINSCYDRTDLLNFVKKFNNVVKYLNKKSNSNLFYYLLIPEYHEDLKCFHLHGFLSSAFSCFEYLNPNGFPSLSCFKKLGFNNVSVIRNYNACVKYCLKYITKDLVNRFGVGSRLYFCSKNLLRQNIINDLVFESIPPIHFDFKSPFVFKTTTNENKYYNFVTNIDSLPMLNYYNYS